MPGPVKLELQGKQVPLKRAPPVPIAATLPGVLVLLLQMTTLAIAVLIEDVGQGHRRGSCTAGKKG